MKKRLSNCNLTAFGMEWIIGLWATLFIVVALESDYLGEEYKVGEI